MQANNNYIVNRFDPGKESCYIQYLDANNLYGWVMSENLPTGGFKLVLLEIDISYPNDLHGLHNDLPFMCEKMKINGVQKLVPNLYSKKKYVIHIAAIDQVLKYKLVLDKVC